VIPGEPHLERISEIKKRINEIAFAPLDEHGTLFEAVNADLNQALSLVEGISGKN
jgi:hypothetical protein